MRRMQTLTDRDCSAFLSSGHSRGREKSKKNLLRKKERDVAANRE